MSCEHGLTTKECYVCMSPKYGKYDTKQERVAKPQGEEHMSIEAMKQALEALEAMMEEFKGYDLPYGSKAYAKAKDATIDLRQAIEQVEKQEPVAYVETKEVHGQMCSFIYRADSTSLLPDGSRLYTTPLNPLDSIKSSKTLDAQPQQAQKQEPFAYLDPGLGAFYWAREYPDGPPPGFEPVYLSPSNKRWVGLTDAEIEEFDYYARDLVMDIEKALKERNNVA